MEGAPTAASGDSSVELFGLVFDGDVEESVVKQGELRKRAIGKGRVGRTNWKTRWFRLTDSGIAYYADKDAPKPKGMIRTEQMDSVTRGKVEHSFELAHYHVTPDGALSGKQFYLLCEAPDDAVRDEWVLALTKAMETFRAEPGSVAAGGGGGGGGGDAAAAGEGKAAAAAAQRVREWEAPSSPTVGEPPAARPGTPDSDGEPPGAATPTPRSRTATGTDNFAAYSDDDETFDGFGDDDD